MSLLQSINPQKFYDTLVSQHEQEMKLKYPLYSIKQDPVLDSIFKAQAMARAQFLYIAHTEIEAKNKDMRNYTTIAGTKQLPASKSTGRATFQATAAGIALPQTTLIKGQNGELYNLQDQYISKVVTYTILSVASDGSGKITLTTNEDILELATNIRCNIAGVSDSTFNQSNATITVTGLRTIEYSKQIPTSNSTGGTISATVLPIVVQSQNFGSQTEILNGADVYLLNINTQDKAYVNFTNIIGGVDAESEEELLLRTKEVLGNPLLPMNDANMEVIARTFPATRDVYIKTSEANGVINVYHMCGSNTPQFPTTQDNENLRNYLLEKALPSGLKPSLLIVQGPTQASYNLHFNFLPSALKNQEFINTITTSLYALFQTYTLQDGLGQSVPISSIEANITNAILKNYSNINPVLDAIITGLNVAVPPTLPTNLPTLGTVTYTP